MNAPHGHPYGSRREFLAKAGGGFGALALSHLLTADAGPNRSPGPGVAAGGPSPLALKRPHRRARARSVIFLFMEGGPS
ncbi:MAG: DUF1501 domain-containing protein, partial [Verrucomicrobiota bacterium]